MTPEQAAKSLLDNPSKRDRQVLDQIAKDSIASMAVLLGIRDLTDPAIITAACVPQQYSLAPLLFSYRPDLHNHPTVRRFLQEAGVHQRNTHQEVFKDARMDGPAAARLLAQYPELSRNRK